MSKRSSISTLGALRQSVERGEVAHRTVQEEVRENLIQALRGGGPLFPGIIGYDDSVVPQLVNALLSQHNFILLGLRGQAKTRLLRALVTLLDEEIPVMPGCEINDDPLAPICSACRARIATDGDRTPIEWLPRHLRYVEKLATPDVTIADMVGDIDPNQGGAVRSAALERDDDALRPAAAREPRHLRDQRAARSGRQDSGRSVQHPAGRRRPD
jgi:magnesium chelatase subunit I